MNSAIATGKVLAFKSAVRTSAIKNSFHADRNTKIPPVNKAGFERGEDLLLFLKQLKEFKS